MNKAFLSPKPVFLFSGQGAQYATMGRELLHLSSSFFHSLEKSKNILHGLGASWDLIDELRKPEAKSRVNSSQLSQPATTAIQIALVHLLAQIGVHPVAALGHSSGEVAAAYAAGMLSHEAALQVSYHKGFVADWCRATTKVNGAMIAVGLGEKDITSYLDSIFSGRASIACVNSPSSVTVSGDEAAVAELKIALDRDSVFNRPLKVDIAYHSHHMLPVAAKFKQSILGITSSAPSVQTIFFSSVKGKQHDEAATPTYWVDNLISKVRFSEGLEQLVQACSKGNHPLTFIEVGPHSALEGPVRQIMADFGDTYKWAYIPTLVRNRDARQAMLEMSGRLWEQGVPVDLSEPIIPQYRFLHDFDLVKDLPAYSWDHSKRYWHESRLSKEYRHRLHAPHDLLGLRLLGTTDIEPVFRLILSVDDLPWLQEHIIDGFALYPGSAFLVHAIEGLKQVIEDGGEKRTIERYHFKSVHFTKSIVIPDSPGTVEVLLSLGAVKATGERLGISWHDFRITSLAADGAWNDNCHGSIGCEFADHTRVGDGVHKSTRIQPRIDELSAQCSEQVKPSDLYTGLRQNGIDYGGNFSIIRTLKVGNHLGIGTVQVPDIAKCMPSGNMQPHTIHPATFDAFMHIALPLYHRFCSEGPVMLTAIGEASIAASIFNKPGDSFTVVCNLTQTHQKFGAVNVSILQKDNKGHLFEVGTLINEEFRGIGEGSSKAKRTPTDGNSSCTVQWVEAPRGPKIFKEPLDFSLQLSSFNNTDKTSGIVDKLISHLNERLSNAVTPWAGDVVASSAIQIVIETDSMPKPTLADINVLFSHAKSVLWLTLYSNSQRVSSGRSLAEKIATIHGVHLVCLDYHDESNNTSLLGDLILELITASFINADKGNAVDFNFRFQRGILLVPRLLQHEASNRWLNSTRENEADNVVNKFHCESPLKLAIKTRGLLSSGIFIPDIEAENPAGPDEIKVRVYAHAVNRSDVAVASARASVTDSMVGEFAGIVVEVGTAAQSKYKPGDRVCGWGATPYASIARVHHRFVQQIDDSTPFYQGAAIPLAFQTAFHSVIDIARLRESQRILIHGAAGAVGQAAISIAQQCGADIYVTVGSEEKAVFLTEIAGLNRNRIFSSRNTNFQKQINEFTGGQGVDVVLNCSSGDLLEPSVGCTAELGVIINVVKSNATSQMLPCDKNISFVNINMDTLKMRFPERLFEIWEQAFAMYASGPAKCPSTTVMSIADLEKAFNEVKREKYIGKIVLVSDDTVCVKQEKSLLNSVKLDKTATYAVIGGSPSVNHSVRNFLADRGAGNTVGFAATPNSYKQDTKALDQNSEVGAGSEKLETDPSTIQGTVKGIIYIMPFIEVCDQQNCLIYE